MLENTIEFESGAIQELLNNGIALMDTAEEVCESLLKAMDGLQQTYSRIPGEAKSPDLPQSIADLRKAINEARSQDPSFVSMRDQLSQSLTRILNDLPFYDGRLAEAIGQSIDMTGRCIEMADSLISLIPVGMSGDYQAMRHAITQCKKDVGELGGQLIEDMKNLSRALKGLELFSIIFSRDPVNLSTGNFYYGKEDLSLKGRYPLSFARSYNALGERHGSLGPDWNHNYETYVEEDPEKGSTTVILADGREDIYQKDGNDIYIPFRFCGSFLEKTVDGYLYTTGEQIRYLFDGEGRNIRQEDRNGNGITLTYTGPAAEETENATPKDKEKSSQSGPCHNPRRVIRVEEDTGNTLFFAYDDQGYLTLVTDQTGRSISLTYRDGRLHTVTGLTGGTTSYTYAGNGKLESIGAGSPDTAFVTNIHDHQGRTVKQLFPDGGEMSYQYLDRERTVILTEQNGNRIHYIHDGQKRHVKTVYTDEAGNPVSEETYEYNSRNRKSRCIDRNGNRRRYKYDSRGNMTEAIDALRQRTGFTYDGQGRITRLKQADGSIFRYEYDQDGNLTKAIDPLDHQQEIRYESGLPVTVTAPDGSTVGISYDNRGNITSLTDASGNQVHYEYDSLGRVVKTTDAEGHTTVFGYNPAGDIVRITNAEGNTREYRYGASGKVSAVTDFDGGVTSYHYDVSGRLEKRTGPGGRIEKFTYDLMGNLTGITDPLGNEIRYEYDRHNRLVRIIDQEGYATRYEHDPNGNVTAVISPSGARTEIDYDQLDRRQTVREADGAVTGYAYDILGNLEKITDPQGGETLIRHNALGWKETVTDALGNTTQYTYSPLGEIETVTDPLGGKQIYGYYPGGKCKTVTFPDGRTETYAYDRNGNMIRVTDGQGNITSLSYDCMDRITAITDPAGNSRRFGYDALGNITSATDENGNTTSYLYSPAGDIIQVTDALGHSTRYGYDKAGRLNRMEQCRLLSGTHADVRSVSDILLKNQLFPGPFSPSGEIAGPEPDIQVTTWERNRRGEVTRVCNPLGGESRYRYDASGNLISRTDEDGLETLYEYNVANQLARILYADGRTVELSYGPLRQLKEMRDWLGTTAIETNGLGRTTKATDHEGRTVRYEWDALSRRKAVTYPDGSRADYRYDTAGRLEEVAAQTGTVRYTYDAAGRLAGRLLPGDITTRYTHDSLGRLTELCHQLGGVVTDRFRYEYDPAGNITGIDKYRTGIAADNGPFRYSYDQVGRLTEVLHGIESRQYRYDSLGNRIQVLHGSVMTDYGYNARNQLIHTRTGEDVTEFCYDRRGNLTRVTENGIIKGRYTFDATDRLAGAFMPGHGQTEYVYNGFLKRVRKHESRVNAEGKPAPAQVTDYIMDLTKSCNDLLAVEGRDNRRFIWGGELLMSEGKEPSCYLGDHLGTPVRGIRAGQETAAAYDEFGIPIMDAGSGATFGFAGEQLEPDSGLYYLRARYYQPETGRFISEDRHWNPQNSIYGDDPASPVPSLSAIIQSRNLYAYCKNDPLRFTDPSGRNAGDSFATGKAALEDLYSGYYGVTDFIQQEMSSCIYMTYQSNSSGNTQVSYSYTAPVFGQAQKIPGRSTNSNGMREIRLPLADIHMQTDGGVQGAAHYNPDSTKSIYVLTPEGNISQFTADQFNSGNITEKLISSGLYFNPVQDKTATMQKYGAMLGAVSPCDEGGGENGITLSNGIFIPEVVTGELNGAPITFHPLDEWGAIGYGSYQKGVQKDANGRYMIAVGPKIIDTSYPDNGKIWGSDFSNFSDRIDITLKHKQTGDIKIIECVVTDIKAHSYNKYPDGQPYNTGDIASIDIESGLLQTGIAYPNSWNASQNYACTPAHMAGSMIEFCGHKLDFEMSDYTLEDITTVN